MHRLMKPSTQHHYLVDFGHPERELPRLICLIFTPDPLSGARSASASSNHRAVSSTIAKDVLLCALDALAQSSDACSPLKSVAGGLMFFATWADVRVQTPLALSILTEPLYSWCRATRKKSVKLASVSTVSSRISSSLSKMVLPSLLHTKTPSICSQSTTQGTPHIVCPS